MLPAAGTLLTKGTLRICAFSSQHWSVYQSVPGLCASQHKAPNPPTCAGLINRGGGILFTIVFCGLFKCVRLGVSHILQMIPVGYSSLHFKHKDIDMYTNCVSVCLEWWPLKTKQARMINTLPCRHANHIHTSSSLLLITFTPLLTKRLTLPWKKHNLASCDMRWCKHFMQILSGCFLYLCLYGCSPGCSE